MISEYNDDYNLVHFACICCFQAAVAKSLRVLVVIAHPESKSFCSALAKASIDTLTAAGHTVTGALRCVHDCAPVFTHVLWEFLFLSLLGSFVKNNAIGEIATAMERGVFVVFAAASDLVMFTVML